MDKLWLSRVAASLQDNASATTLTALIFVGLLQFELITTDLPIMLSYTSALSPIMVRSKTAEFTTTAFLPICVKLSMHEFTILAPSSIWQ